MTEWEIWLFTSTGVRGPVDECGLFLSRGEAERMVGGLLLWLRLGTWSDSAFDKLRPKEQRLVFRMRQGLRAFGLAAGDIRVEVRAHGVTGDNQMDPPDVGADDAGDDDDRDPPDDGADAQTPLEPVQVVYRTLAANGTAVVFR